MRLSPLYNVPAGIIEIERALTAHKPHVKLNSETSGAKMLGTYRYVQFHHHRWPALPVHGRW